MQPASVTHRMPSPKHPNWGVVAKALHMDSTKYRLLARLADSPATRRGLANELGMSTPTAYREYLALSMELTDDFMIEGHPDAGGDPKVTITGLGLTLLEAAQVLLREKN